LAIVFWQKCFGVIIIYNGTNVSTGMVLTYIHLMTKQQNSGHIVLKCYKKRKTMLKHVL